MTLKSNDNLSVVGNVYTPNAKIYNSIILGSDSFTSANVRNWNLAYNRRDHSQQGYLTEIPKNVALQPSRVAINAGNSRYKISLWGGTTYAIGMYGGATLGALNDYAMTFQMNDSATRGFWWGHRDDALSQGAMSLTTDGRLYVADQLQVGRGRGHTSGLHSAYTVEFYGHTKVTNGNLYIDGQQIGSSDVTSFKTAYSWGNHASAGYLKAVQMPLN